MLVKFESVKDGEMLVNTEWVTTVFPVKRGKKTLPGCCINVYAGDRITADYHEVHGTLDEVAAKLNGEQTLQTPEDK